MSRRPARSPRWPARPAPPLGDGGPATGATLQCPTDVAFDASGSLFIADTGNSRVRKVDASGIITTLAGNGSAGFSVDGGPASAAELSRPQVLAPGPSGAWSSPTRATTGSGRWTPPWRHAEGN